MKDIAAFILVILILAGGITYLVIRDIQNFERKCRSAGGHVITVRDADICVDVNQRVIYT